MRTWIVTRASAVGVTLLLSACAQTAVQLRYSKAGGTEEQFKQDRYECLREAQQPASQSYVNAYGGRHESAVITNGSLLVACMNARGYAVGQEGTWAPSSPVAVPM